VCTAVQWLKASNPFYADTIISEDNVSLYPTTTGEDDTSAATLQTLALLCMEIAGSKLQLRISLTGCAHTLILLRQYYCCCCCKIAFNPRSNEVRRIVLIERLIDVCSSCCWLRASRLCRIANAFYPHPLRSCQQCHLYQLATLMTACPQITHLTSNGLYVSNYSNPVPTIAGRITPFHNLSLPTACPRCL
jgi:hypothetical protein